MNEAMQQRSTTTAVSGSSRLDGSLKPQELSELGSSSINIEPRAKHSRRCVALSSRCRYAIAGVTLAAAAGASAVVIFLSNSGPPWTVDYSSYAMPSGASSLKAVIVPGCCNEGVDVRGALFYGWLAARLKQHPLFDEVVLENMPDPHLARRSTWIPYMLHTLGVDNRTVLIGHSTGSVASMRLSEKHRTQLVLLLPATPIWVGQTKPSAAIIRPWRPWLWDSICRTPAAIAILHSVDDSIVPFDEAQRSLMSRCTASGSPRSLGHTTHLTSELQDTTSLARERTEEGDDAP